MEDVISEYPYLSKLYHDMNVNDKLMCDIRYTIYLINEHNDYKALINNIHDLYLKISTSTPNYFLSCIDICLCRHLSDVYGSGRITMNDSENIISYYINVCHTNVRITTTPPNLDMFLRYILNISGRTSKTFYDAEIYDTITSKIFDAMLTDDVDEMLLILSDPLSYKLDDMSYSYFLRGAMYYGSVKCFKTLLSMNRYNENEMDISYAIIGGNYEIFHIVENRFCIELNLHHVIVALKYARFDIAEYIINRLEPSILNEDAEQRIKLRLKMLNDY